MARRRRSRLADAGAHVDVRHDGRASGGAVRLSFAEELYQALPADIQDSMCLIAVAGVRSRRLVERLFPAHEREKALREVVDAGWLTMDADENFELHPLLEAFLRQKLDSEPTPETRAKAAAITSMLAVERQWDEAFGVIRRYSLDDALQPLVRAALEDLLSSGRTATLQGWVWYSERSRPLGRSWISHPLSCYSERVGSTSQRYSRYQPAENLPSGWLGSRAYASAGRAAHAANRELQALSHYRSARDASVSAWTVRCCPRRSVRSNRPRATRSSVASFEARPAPDESKA